MKTLFLTLVVSIFASCHTRNRYNVTLREEQEKQLHPEEEKQKSSCDDEEESPANLDQ